MERKIRQIKDKGRLSIPKEILKEMGIEDGDYVSVIIKDKTININKVKMIEEK